MNLTGRTFGRLKVIRPAERQGYVLCECSCGNVKAIRATSLTKRHQPTRSCGCIQREAARRIGASTVNRNAKPQVETNLHFNTNFQVIEKVEPAKNNRSGYTGVWRDNNRGLWEAYIQVHGKRKFLGRYALLEDAVKARRAAEEAYFIPLIELKGDHTT